MRSSAALLVVTLLVVSSAAGVGASHPADDRVQSSSDLPDSSTIYSDSLTVFSDSSAAFSDSSTIVSAFETTNGTTANGTASNETVHDETEMYVSLRQNGDAQWNVTARFVLGDEDETAAFQELAKDYENGDSDSGFSAKTFERVVEYAASDSDRQMSVQSVTRSAQLLENQSVGVLSLSFTWTNFTQVEGSQIVMGDVFWVGSETWLPDLTEEQTLVIEGPPGYIITGASPSGGTISSGNVLHYKGPQQFNSGDFAVTYSPRSTTTETTTKSTTSPGVLSDVTGPSAFIILLLLFSLGGVGAYAWSRRNDEEPVVASDERPPEPAPASQTDGAVDTSSDAIVDSNLEQESEPDAELLSDEERVLRLLRDNDGRMKQAQIVKETNWSNAKVSQLLSKMDDSEDVDKLRIGRENLISLPDEDVTDTE